jgi:FkbM family methyltransferase
MGLGPTLRSILDHPLNRGHKLQALRRYLYWQFASRLLPGPCVLPFVDGSRLVVAPGMTGATGNIYSGLLEFEDMAFLLHFLRAGDTFLDVGANVGAYTVLASAVCGARTLAFEPASGALRHLADNVRLNGIESLVESHCTAIGRDVGTVRFTTGLDTVNHIAPNPRDNDGATLIDVPVLPLDHFAARPAMIKIDVEGFETNVIGGAGQTLRSNTLMAILMELNGSGARYGFDESELHAQMIEAGFRPFVYRPFERTLVAAVDRRREGNTLYLRDPAGCETRVRQARKFLVRATGTSL